MAKKRNETFRDDWVDSYVDAIELLHGPLIDETAPSTEEINELLMENCREGEILEQNQILERWINLYLAFIDFLHGVFSSDIRMNIEEVNEDWIRCFQDEIPSLEQEMISRWADAYLDLFDPELRTEDAQDQMEAIREMNQDLARIFYQDYVVIKDHIPQSWVEPYIDLYEELFGLNYLPVLDIEDVNEQWIKLFMTNSEVKKVLKKVA